MVSNRAYEMSPTKKRLIHHHMKHPERTADANYVIKLNADRASRAHALVTDIIHESGDSPPKHQALSPHSSSSAEDDDMPLGVVLARTPAAPSNTQWETPSSILSLFQTENSTGKLRCRHHRGQIQGPQKSSGQEGNSTFRQDPVLSHILEREGETCRYEKVKTLLRRTFQ